MAKTGTIIKLIVGLVLLILGAWAIYSWWPEFFLIIRGCVGPFLLLAGIIILAVAKD